MILALISINAVIAANLTIEADNQQFVDAQNEAKFTGNIKVKLDDITVESPVADAQLDPKSKKLTTANFKNKAHAYQVKNNKKNEVKAEIIKKSSGSVRQNLSFDEFESIAIPLINYDEIAGFNENAYPLWDKYNNLTAEINQLNELKQSYLNKYFK